MSRQQTNSEIVSESRSKANTTAALKRLVRRNLPRKRDRLEAIERATVRPHYEVVRHVSAYDAERFKRLERDIFKGMRVSRDGLGKA
jgi:hypothetical protein